MTTGENVGDVSARCQKIVDDANAGRITLDDAQAKLQAEGISDSVLNSFLIQLQKPTAESGGVSASESDRGKTPEGLDENQREDFRKKRAEILGSRGTGAEGPGRTEGQAGSSNRQAGNDGVDGASGMASAGPDHEVQAFESNVLAQQLKAIRRLVSSDSGSISASTLDSLPHLREKASSSGDHHVDETLRTKRIYLNEQNLDALIDLFQNEYVSFEKLLAGIDPSYDHQDEGKDFGAGYTLVKTDHLSAKKPVTTESDWNRAFGAWKNGVLQAYPHRESELSSYESGISNLFRNFAHDPSIPIRADHEVRERYHKSPFRLDDSNRTQAAVMALVHRTSTGTRTKRLSDSNSSSRPSKRSGGAICLNWNSARCDDPCINGRRHGTCSVCRGKHRAYESTECKTEFLARRSRNAADRESGAGGPSRA
ncbi:hypothetical protein F5878DRAFT_548414 [Lentinula raphanica]|uniref:Uncharacterized protein n=1 Tax=Lentinula raphanica TaxID=153919 RepID=A0AA38U625_9AGAR|nr:hypothetical protein F5878DRAFT_548414 [Lentinula raphanica]